MSRERDFDDLYNEGGEGYNPYRGEDAQRSMPAPAKPAEPTYLWRGVVRSRTYMLATLAQREQSLARCTDAAGREINERAIAEIRALIDARSAH